MTQWLTTDGGYVLALIASAVLLGLILLSSRREWERFRAPVRRVCRVQLTRRHSVHLLHWNGRQYLVACAGRAMEVIAQDPMPPQPQVLPSAPVPLQPQERVAKLRPIPAPPGADPRAGHPSAASHSGTREKP